MIMLRIASLVIIGAAVAGLPGASQASEVFGAHAQPGVLLVAQATNQNRNANQNQVQGQTQNQNQNQNQNRNQNGGEEGEQDEGPAAAGAAARTVCFFDLPDFKGDGLCADPGQRAVKLTTDWDNRISSVEIKGKAEVTVCTDASLTGTCRELTSSAATLPAELNDAISSFKVEE